MNSASSPWVGLASYLKTVGSLSADAQRVLSGHMQQHTSPEVLARALAEALLWEAIRDRKLPSNCGRLEPALEQQAHTGCKHVVSAYRSAGGVLLARGYVTERVVVDHMILVWKRDFVETPSYTRHLLHGMPPEEANHRLTLCALAVRDLVREQKKVDTSQGSGYLLTEDDLEGFCRRAATALMTAFENEGA